MPVTIKRKLSQSFDKAPTGIAFCREHLAGSRHVEIVDVLLHAERALADGIMPKPTLIRFLPVPVRTIIGTLADKRALLQTLGLVVPAP